MTEIEFQLAGIKNNLSYLLDKFEKLPVQQPFEKPLPENINLNMAAELKGGCTLATYRTRSYLQPCGGTNSVRIGGRKCWRKSDVLEWLSIDDAHLDEYLERFGIKMGK